MVKKHTHKSITWIEVENPSREEIRSLASEYDIDMNTAMELELPTYKEKIIPLKNYLYMVMHFPALRHSHMRIEQEVDFIIGKNFIITTRYETIDALEKFSKTFEMNEMLDKNLMEDHAGYVLYYIIKELYMAISDELDAINDNLKFIERNVFNEKEKEMVAEISRANRNLLNIEHTVNPHDELLQDLRTESIKFFGEGFSDNMDKILNEYYRVQKVLSGNIDFLKEIRETNDSLLSSKQNEIMQLLTVITFLALPFSMITDFVFQEGLFGTSIFSFMRSNSEFILLFQIILFIIVFTIAKKNKWL